jgi:AcrR family transcriptional regulator
VQGLDNVVRSGRGRRPQAQVRNEILATAAKLLFEAGIGSLTFEKVAAATPCSKVTLYKWWASPGVLAAEAFFATAGPVLAFPDTGDVEEDLKRQLRGWIGLLGQPGVGPVIAGLIGASQSDPELAEAWSMGYSRPRRVLAVDRLERARSQGQLAHDVDCEVLVDQLWGACYHRLLIPDEPLTEEFTDALIRVIVEGRYRQRPGSRRLSRFWRGTSSAGQSIVVSTPPSARTAAPLVAEESGLER